MRLTECFAFAFLLSSLSPFLVWADGQPGTPGAPPKNPEDLLGNMTVFANSARALPKIGVLPSLASDLEDVTLRSVVRRDLDLCGEFEVISDEKAPDGLYLSDSPVDVKAWGAKGAEAVVKVNAKRTPQGRVEFKAEAYFVNQGATPVFSKTMVVGADVVRVESHRVADLLIGALTGQNGGFASHMTFASGTGTLRRVFTIDADGNNAKGISPQDRIAIAPAFGKDEQLYYAASSRGSEYQIYTENGALVPLSVKGSVYGIAFSKDRSKVAVSVGVGDTISLFLGSDFSDLKPASPIGMALHPAFTPGGKLAFSGEGKTTQRIYLDNKAITSEGLFASAPAFCNHPDGVRAVFAVGVGKNTDLVSTNEKGQGMVRLTQNQGSNGYPACSPDGRLVAFFSTRISNEGPGLYIMRIDGGRPKRVSTLLGDSLRWDSLPAPKDH